MADQSAIDSVKLQIPNEALALGITDEIIGSQLDSGVSQTKTILLMLRSVAAKSASIEDVSENGSSRTQRLNERVMTLIADWQARADAEDAAAGVIPFRGNAVSRRITRV